ncbi:MAG: response regulator [Nitrospirales bacterium]
MNPRSILLIDDNDHIRAFLRKALEQAGYTVLEASDGRKGLRQFRQTLTALVITDVLMPDGDGLEVTMALRRGSPTVKIIVLTGVAEEGGFLKVATLLGTHRAMRKPVAITDLLHAVQETLQVGADSNGPGQQGVC